MGDDCDRLVIYRDERAFFERLADGVQLLLSRPDLEPREIAGLGHLLQALSILPFVDSAISVMLSVYPLPDSNNLDLILSIGDDELELAVIERFDEPQGVEAAIDSVMTFDVCGERKFGEQWSAGYWLREWEEAISSNESRLDVLDNSNSRRINWALTSTPNDFLDDELRD